MSTERHQVVVIGGGFGGLNVTKALTRMESRLRWYTTPSGLTPG